MLICKNQIYVGYLCILYGFGQGTAKPLIWIKTLFQYITNNTEIHQLVISFDMNPMIIIPEEELVIRLLSKTVPSWKISFQEATEERAKDWSMNTAFYNPRGTSIFVIISMSRKHRNLSYLDGPINFFSRIAEYRSRPKCLFIFSHGREQTAYDQLLRRMWSMQFLDVMILEVPDKKKNGDAMVHYFNPFTNETLKANFSSNMSWFPNKASNLFGYNMKVGVFNRPPSVVLSLNKTGNITSISGNNIMFIKTLAKAMNFSISWTTSKRKVWEHIGCSNYNETGLIGGKSNYSINFIATQSGRISSCYEGFYEWSRFINTVKIVFIAPVIPGASSNHLFNLKLVNLAFLTTLLFVIWGLVKLLHFESDKWQMLYIAQVILGSPIPQDPQKVAERIAFGFLLLACMMNSSFIYSAITGVEVQTNAMLQLNSIDDVLLSPLKLVVDINYYKSQYKNAEGIVKLLLDKSIQYELTYQECLDLLAKNRNIVCLAREEIGKMNVLEKLDANYNPVMKIIDEVYLWASGTIMMESRSPFTSRFNDLISRIRDSGLIVKWENNQFRFLNVTVHEDKDLFLEGLAPTKTVKQFTVLLFSLHILSCIVFLGELIIDDIRKYCFKCQRFYWNVKN